MASHYRVFNETKNYHMKYKQALRAIENCAAVWIEPGRVLRDATLQESINMRNELAKQREPLADSEILGLKFQPNQSFAQSAANSRRLAYEANVFAVQAGS